MQINKAYRENMYAVTSSKVYAYWEKKKKQVKAGGKGTECNMQMIYVADVVKHSGKKSYKCLYRPAHCLVSENDRSLNDPDWGIPFENGQQQGQLLLLTSNIERLSQYGLWAFTPIFYSLCVRSTFWRLWKENLDINPATNFPHTGWLTCIMCWDNGVTEHPHGQPMFGLLETHSTRRSPCPTLPW